MDQIKSCVEQLKVVVTDMDAEIEKAETKGFVYARSKNIRGFAQQIKLIAQDIRVITNDEFKSSKE